jgi:methylphosphotriester-DNA--protein-cysteine methyltransferase
MIDRLSHDQLWDQVIRREPGDFLYAVATMGIYCKPGCPSPRPLRKNVRFFRNCGEAETAGFRACRRCDPKGDRARLAQSVVQDACAFIEASEDIPSLDALATRSGYSRFHFLRMFRDHTGLTPRSYAEGVRAKRLHVFVGRRAGCRCGGRCRLWLGEPCLRKDRRAARHDAGRIAARRERGVDPHRVRRLSVRTLAGRRHR